MVRKWREKMLLLIIVLLKQLRRNWGAGFWETEWRGKWQKGILRWCSWRPRCTRCLRRNTSCRGRRPPTCRRDLPWSSWCQCPKCSRVELWLRLQKARTTPSLHSGCFKYARYLFEICSRVVRNMFKICLKYVRIIIIFFFLDVVDLFLFVLFIKVVLTGSFLFQPCLLTTKNTFF